MLRKYIIFFSFVTLLATAHTGVLAQQAKKKPESAPPEKVSKADSNLARTDRALILEKELSAEKYISRREQFRYPRTRRQDPFDLPFSDEGPKEELGPSLGDVELSGVLYSPVGRSIAIMTLGEDKEGTSFLIHEGDMLGSAELILIEPSNVTFRISAYGQMRTIIKELKPLMEGKDVQSSEQTGEESQKEELSQEEIDEYGGSSPEDR